MYGLGDRYSQNHASVESHLWWKGGWQFHWHRVVAYQPAVFRLGTYSLPLPEGRWAELKVNSGFAHASNGQHGVAVQPLFGFQGVKANESEPQKRTHLLAWHSLTLTAETEKITGERHLLALTWVGLNQKEREPWKVISSADGKLKLRHPTLGEWEILHAELPELLGATA